MGCEFDEEEAIMFKEIVDLEEDDQICFKTWLGLCSFSERFYGIYLFYIIEVTSKLLA